MLGATCYLVVVMEILHTTFETFDFSGARINVMFSVHPDLDWTFRVVADLEFDIDEDNLYGFRANVLSYGLEDDQGLPMSFRVLEDLFESLADRRDVEKILEHDVSVNRPLMEMIEVELADYAEEQATERAISNFENHPNYNHSISFSQNYQNIKR